ncbi:MAG: NTP transferase domain-containing protein [Candidatus Nanopelagicales bacterium]
MNTGNASIPDSIIVAGGRATRMGGVDKAMLPLGLSGETLLADIIKSCPGKVFVVGNPREIGIDTADLVTWVPDLNPGGGPAAGIWSGLTSVTSEYVFISAADQTLSSDTVSTLIAAALGRDGAWAIRSDGNGQPLCACVRTELLRDLLTSTQGANQSPLRLLSSLQMVGVNVNPDQVVDFDTWQDVAKAVNGSEAMDQITQMWMTRVATLLDVDPHEVLTAELLDLTREVAHGVERKSAPLTTFLLGYAAGKDSLKPEEVRKLIETVSNAVAEWQIVD